MGIIFISFIYPVLESTISLYLTWIEYLKGILTVKITRLQVEIQKMAEPVDDEPARVIGFTTEHYEEYEDDDDDDL